MSTRTHWRPRRRQPVTPDRAITCPAVLNRIAPSVCQPMLEPPEPTPQRHFRNLTPSGWSIHTIVSVTVGVVDLAASMRTRSSAEWRYPGFQISSISGELRGRTRGLDTPRPTAELLDAAQVSMSLDQRLSHRQRCRWRHEHTRLRSPYTPSMRALAGQ